MITYLQTDEQTIEDLGLFGKRDKGGIYDLYNQLHTRGGEALLEEMFRSPLSDEGAINQRSSIIRQFASLGLGFPYDAALFDMAEKYLSNHPRPGQHGQEHVLGEKEIQNGVMAVISLIHLTKTFMEKQEVATIAGYAPERTVINTLLTEPALAPALKEMPGKGHKLPYAAITAYDALFRVSENDKIIRLLRHIYMLDVYLSVARTAAERKFVFPAALEKGTCTLKVTGVYHPSLKAPVGNNIEMYMQRNIIFLTGANMAGKSTFLRSLSTALYLAHMGFPVAATSMEFSVMDGLYTTINLPDNLGIGASHFYAEVLRVKKIAKELSAGKLLFVLFDELFRGTNVKDAQEATIAIIKGFAKQTRSLFLVSSHIVEAGEALRQEAPIGFFFLPTRMEGHTPAYTYTLEEGITDDRHGMIIIRNEGILDILQKGKQQTDNHPNNYELQHRQTDIG
ncbi:MutS-related protein [Chitinophaga eiseniae]|uniref:DNA mismatch repair protein n=1 Tax=Chitinophaga eiseniae TaxID=634771 RepID=A0A847S6B4_9BACT|nr:DNA mismatch repair protein [Chitinophaga eiseniae]NLR77311.1 DNA mismatch repair protein [Chitinophaga eiseniae]